MFHTVMKKLSLLVFALSLCMFKSTIRGSDSDYRKAVVKEVIKPVSSFFNNASASSAHSRRKFRTSAASARAVRRIIVDPPLELFFKNITRIISLSQLVMIASQNQSKKVPFLQMRASKNLSIRSEFQRLPNASDTYQEPFREALTSYSISQKVPLKKDSSSVWAGPSYATAVTYSYGVVVDENMVNAIDPAEGIHIFWHEAAHHLLHPGGELEDCQLDLLRTKKKDTVTQNYLPYSLSYRWAFNALLAAKKSLLLFTKKNISKKILPLAYSLAWCHLKLAIRMMNASIYFFDHAHSIKIPYTSSRVRNLLGSGEEQADSLDAIIEWDESSMEHEADACAVQHLTKAGRHDIVAAMTRIREQDGERESRIWKTIILPMANQELFLNRRIEATIGDYIADIPGIIRDLDGVKFSWRTAVLPPAKQDLFLNHRIEEILWDYIGEFEGITRHQEDVKFSWKKIFSNVRP